jgi:hypothetical protein
MNAVTVAGPGATQDLGSSQTWHSLSANITNYTGTGNWTVILEASLDNVNFFQLQAQSLGQNAFIHFVGVPSCPARYVRANLALDAGITAIAVTAWVASA